MSSNNQNDASMGLALVGVACFFLMFAVYAIALVLAGVFTLLSIITLARGRTLPLWGKHKIDPAEAKIFLVSGCAGAIGLPAFAQFCGMLMDVRVPHEWDFYLITGGYAFVSLAVCAYLEENNPEILHPADYTVVDVTPVAPQPTQPLPTPAAFEFASWEDDGAQEDGNRPECAGCAWNEPIPESKPSARG